MNPNTYHWLQSVCLPLTPTKHLNSRDLWWVEGWKLLLPVCLISRALLLSLFNLFSFPLCPVQIYSFALFHLQRKISDRGVIPPVCLAVSLDGLCHWYFLILPSPSPPHLLPFLFLLAGCSHIFVCSCEGVSDACVVRGGRGSSRAWREHTLWELPFITPSPNEQHAECNTDAITFRNSFS